MQDFVVTGNYADDIVNFIKWRGDHVTFVELIDAVPEFEGDLTLYKGEGELVLWCGVSQLFIDAFNQVIDEKKVYTWLCHPRTYLLDGRALKLPLAQRAQNYKTPHWLPLTLALKPPTEADLMAIAKSYPREVSLV